MNALFAGSFHPPTNGHLDIIERAAKLFDTLYVAVMANAQKTYLLSAETRKAMIERATGGLKNVKVVIGDGLTVDTAKRLGCAFLVRGVRDSGDYEYEYRMADLNRRLSGIDTLLLPAKSELSSVSASVICDIARHGGDISAFVPETIKHEFLSAINKGV